MTITVGDTVFVSGANQEDKALGTVEEIDEGKIVIAKAESSGYKYKVGDSGFLSNGIDTYRIAADDANIAPKKGLKSPLLALIVSNAHNEGGAFNPYETTKVYTVDGWDQYHVYGGVLGDPYYDLTPPGTVPTPDPR